MPPRNKSVYAWRTCHVWTPEHRLRQFNQLIIRLLHNVDASLETRCSDIHFFFPLLLTGDWHWFAYSGMSDTAAGIAMLVFALLLLCICLVCIVKTLHSLLKGGIALVIKKFVNADFPGYTAFLTGYLAIIIGALCTFVVQSSSIFTSALTPLVGIGVISLERMYPLTLGSNIGTTATGIIAALPNSGQDLANALQVALSHFFFNIFGIIIWYPFPFMRAAPITMARTLGNTTAKYRWFALFYLALMFFVFPALAFALSIAGDVYLFVIGGIILITSLAIAFINVMQRKRPKFLPRVMRNWEWLPWWMHSLKPLDHVFGCRVCCKRFRRDDDEERIVAYNHNGTNHENGGNVNVAMEYDTRLWEEKMRRTVFRAKRFTKALPFYFEYSLRNCLSNPNELF